jgi:hypothetical protein
MKVYELRTNNEPTSIKLGLESKRPIKSRVVVYNPSKPNTFYLDRLVNLNGKEDIEIYMPQNAEKVVLGIQSVGAVHDDFVRITNLEKTSLKQFEKCYNRNSKVLEFIKFAQWFSENCAVLKAGTYYSENKKFRIDLLPVIVDGGRVLTTPARISNTTGRIEVSKQHFIKNTVPMRMAILLHEFAHFNLNIKQHDEIEADLNALKIYLALGYPVIEAHKAFLHVFKVSATSQNKERYEYLKEFIDNFDKLKYRICIR